MSPRSSPLRRLHGLSVRAGPGFILALLSAGALQAAPPPPGGGLFISPFGEPFRSPSGLADWFAGADVDKDGALTLQEFRADGLRFHARLDTDRDGRVDGFENTAYENEVAPEILPQSAVFRNERPGGEGPTPSARGLDGASSFGLLDEPQPVRGADQNYDGRITAEEQARAAARRFALLDEAEAGRLTLPPLLERLETRQAPPAGIGLFFRRRPD